MIISDAFESKGVIVKKHFLAPISLGALALALSLPAFAGVGTSLQQTADVIQPGAYEIKLQTDIIFNRGGGFIVSPHFVTGVIDHMIDVDLYIGTGYTDFQAGALAKYNLLPDIEGQVGLSFLAGASVSIDSTVAGTQASALLTSGIVVSKSFTADFGRFAPYTSLEVEGFLNGTASTLPITLILGSRWDPNVTTPWRFYSEFSFGLKDSFYGVSLGAAYPF